MNKKEKGFTLVELLVVIAILGILMGSLFPAISSAMLSAQLSAMLSNGRNIYVGITQANSDRETHGREPVWPKKKNATTGGAANDIADQAYSDADTYFEKLFDMEHYGDTSYNSYIDTDIKFLSGSGVPAYKGNKSLKGCIAWKIVADLTSDMPGAVPVLVSRNLDTTRLYRSGTNNSSTDTEIIKQDNTHPQPFGNKASVIIHKDASAASYKGRYQTPYDIYGKQTITFAEGAEIDYLNPSEGK